MPTVSTMTDAATGHTRLVLANQAATRPPPGASPSMTSPRNLGVSLSTVSLALNGKGTISAATRDRVFAEASADRLRRQPVRDAACGAVAAAFSDSASGPWTRPAPTGLPVSTTSAGWLARLRSRLWTVASASCWCPCERATRNRKGRYGSTVTSWRTRGPTIPSWADLLDSGIPVVTIGWDPASKTRTAWVSTADRDASNKLLDLLAARGARRICFISGTERNSWNAEAERAYRAWCRAHHMPARLLRLPESAGEDGGAQIAEQLLAGPDAPDAIYCQTGRHAAGVARTALSMGLRIPHDLLVAAGNDAEQARSSDPAITAIDLQPETLGHEAVDLLADIIDHGSRQRSRVVSARLIERASTDR